MAMAHHSKAMAPANNPRPSTIARLSACREAPECFVGVGEAVCVASDALATADSTAAVLFPAMQTFGSDPAGQHPLLAEQYEPAGQAH